MPRKVYTLKNIPRDIAEAIMQSKMDSKYDYLNYLMDDNSLPIPPKLYNQVQELVKDVKIDLDKPLNIEDE